MHVKKKSAKPLSQDSFLAPSKPRKRSWLKRKLLLGLFIILGYYLVIPPFVWPIRGPITSGYFFRVAPDWRVFPSLELHSGVDIACPRGSAIRASKGGMVTQAGRDAGAGNYIVIEHWLGFSTFYCHLDRIEVTKGQYVFKWQEIGKSGSTGRSTGPHLHFETRFLSARLPPDLFTFFDSIHAWIGL